MIARIKNSAFGKRLYRFSRVPYFGYPLRIMARAVQSEALQIAHLKTENRAHNAHQAAILTAFEKKKSS